MTATTDPLTCRRTAHPGLPNVADLATDRDRLLGQVAALTGYLDRTVLALATSRGRTVAQIRVELGLPTPIGDPR